MSKTGKKNIPALSWQLKLALGKTRGENEKVYEKKTKKV